MSFNKPKWFNSISIFTWINWQPHEKQLAQMLQHHTKLHSNFHRSLFVCDHCLIGLTVKASASRGEDPGFESHLHRDFLGSSHISDSKIGTPVATLPGAWRYRVIAGTGWPGVSILWLGEMESWICNFYLSVAARTIVWADPSLRYTHMLLGR